MSQILLITSSPRVESYSTKVARSPGGDRERFRPLTDNLWQSDPFLVLADYADYAACQERVNAAWQDQERWTRMSILNTARGRKFSADRAIGDCSERIWHAQPVKITPG